MEVGLLAALLGGALALLSPCGALLLPAFFAATIGSRGTLLAHAAVFYLGMALLLVPLGLGAATLGTFLATYRSEVIAGASVLMIGFGLAQMLGFGFDVGRALPGVRQLESRAARSAGYAKSFLLGIVSAVAGFCAGPILGAVLTIAAAQGDQGYGAALMAVYALGMVLPLFGLALVWQRLTPQSRRRMRGRTLTVFGRELHTISLVTGVIFVVVGVLFWTTNGFLTLPSLVPAAWQDALTSGAASLTGRQWDVIAVLALGVVAIVGWVLWWRRRERRRAEAASDRTSEDAPSEDAPSEENR